MRCRGCGATTATWRWSPAPAGMYRRLWRWKTWSKTLSAPFATGRTVAEWVLEEPDWATRERMEQKRVDDVSEPHRLRPRQLRVSHPGFGVVLGGEWAKRYLARAGYGATSGGATVARDHLLARA